MNDPIASLIARLIAERWLPRDDVAVRDLLTDAELRNDLDRRLASVGMRLLEHPYAANIAVGIARPQESAVFGSAKAWSSTNLQLDRDAIALLVVLWALLVLPKRQRQIARQQADRDQDQEQMFAELKPVPVGAEVVEPINERTLLADFGEKLGGKTRIQFSLGTLARQGFIVRRKERIHEGPLLDLALDYERIAGRVMDGALTYVVAEARQHALELAAQEAAEAAAAGEGGVDATATDATSDSYPVSPRVAATGAIAADGYIDFDAAAFEASFTDADPQSEFESNADAEPDLALDPEDAQALAAEPLPQLPPQAAESASQTPEPSPDTAEKQEAAADV
ncbi:hypothetical protein [Lysobacter sp. CA199]|uniref:hypothetical protein n=1 Tax=Lysobacter sp. CA199 TaxID=3455608 RepID=UPI003F8D86C9